MLRASTSVTIAASSVFTATAAVAQIDIPYMPWNETPSALQPPETGHHRLMTGRSSARRDNHRLWSGEDPYTVAPLDQVPQQSWSRHHR